MSVIITKFSKDDIPTIIEADTESEAAEGAEGSEE